MSADDVLKCLKETISTLSAIEASAKDEAGDTSEYHNHINDYVENLKQTKGALEKNDPGYTKLACPYHLIHAADKSGDLKAAAADLRLAADEVHKQSAMRENTIQDFVGELEQLINNADTG